MKIELTEQDLKDLLAAIEGYQQEFEGAGPNTDALCNRLTLIALKLRWPKRGE